MLFPQRINLKREFFRIQPEQAIELLELMALEDMAPQFQQEADCVDLDAKAASDKIKRSRRPNLNYLEIGIPIGSTLLYVSDGKTTCTVVDG